MPYIETQMPAPFFLEHAGVWVYHTYENADINLGGQQQYWFVTHAYHGVDEAFDVRELSTFAGWKGVDYGDAYQMHIANAIRKAIDAGELEANEEENEWRGMMSCCGECGSLDVQKRVWVDINTRLEANSCDMGTYWCEACDKELESDRLMTVSEWQAAGAKKDDDENK
jgi:hypothetical protein